MELKDRAREYQSQAQALGYLDSLPRTIVHSDINWGNIVRNRGQLILIDLEGAGVAPAVMDLVEVTTNLCAGPSGSGPLDEEAAEAFYRGYRMNRVLAPEEVESLPDAHLFHQVYFLADSLERGDFDFLSRMGARLANWEKGAYEKLIDAASRK